MDMTLGELAETLNPAMTPDQVRTLAWLAGIEPSGIRRADRPGRTGRPRHTYNQRAIQTAHAEEATRTRKQFSDSDWIASALLTRRRLYAETLSGELWWPDGSRAEHLTHNFYGCVRIPRAEIHAHRIIWIAANGEIPAGLQINHRNRLRWDNRLDNLELVTFIHNIRHGTGEPYMTYHQAVAQLPAEAPAPPEPDGSTRVGGAFRLRDGLLGR